jgi:rare lipoprotein A
MQSLASNLACAGLKPNAATHVAQTGVAYLSARPSGRSVQPICISLYRYPRHGLALSLAVLMLAACTGSVPVAARPGDNMAQGGNAPDAVPKVEPKSPYGNPPFYIVAGKRYDVLSSSKGFVERGIASWYGPKFHGRRASSGEIYNMYAMTAAHPRLPLPTYVRVTNLENGCKAILKVNDRGPFHDGRIIDLSFAAARKLGILERGTGPVEVRALDASSPPATPLSASTTHVTSAQRPSLFVQVGAFSELPNAEQLRAQLVLHQMGDIHIHPDDNSENPLYRVRIGPLPSVDAAALMAQRLEAMGVRDFRVIVE